MQIINKLVYRGLGYIVRRQVRIVLVQYLDNDAGDIARVEEDNGGGGDLYFSGSNKMSRYKDEETTAKRDPFIK